MLTGILVLWTGFFIWVSNSTLNSNVYMVSGSLMDDFVAFWIFFKRAILKCVVLYWYFFHLVWLSGTFSTLLCCQIHLVELFFLLNYQLWGGMIKDRQTLFWLTTYLVCGCLHIFVLSFVMSYQVHWIFGQINFWICQDIEIEYGSN